MGAEAQPTVVGSEEISEEIDLEEIPEHLTITLTIKEKERETIYTDTNQPTSETPVVTTKKSLVAKPTTQVAKAKSLPKMGSKKANVSLIIAGFLLVDVALLVAFKKVRLTKN